MNIENEITKAVAYGMGVICGKHNLDLAEDYIKKISSEYAQQQVKNLNIPAVIKSLPEYNEILYHAKLLSDEQFREYWNEVQGNVL